MAIQLDCPRCKKPLSVPRKKIGRYVNCPRCGGRFWVPENGAASASGIGAGQRYREHIGRLFVWIGRLRQFAEITAEKGTRFPPQSLAGIDAAVAVHGKPAQALYDQGRQQSRDRKQEIENQAKREKQNRNLAEVTRLLTVDRYLLNEYVHFPFDDVSKQIDDGLDRHVPRY
jgi:hypothetical protein